MFENKIHMVSVLKHGVYTAVYGCFTGLEPV